MNNKKYLIITDTCNPDTSSGAKLIQDLIFFLKKNKKKTLTICARDQKFFNLNKNKNIIDVNCGAIKNKNFLYRGISEFIMSYKLIKTAMKEINRFRPNVLICYSPSIFYSPFIRKISKKNKIKKFLILRDIFPYWAIDCGYIRNFFIIHILKIVFKNFFILFNKVGVEAKTNIKYLRKIFKYSKNIEYLPNWIKYKKVEKISKLKNSLIFSGNLGLGQDFNKILSFYQKIEKEKFTLNFLIDEFQINKIKRTNKIDNSKNIFFYKFVKNDNFIKFLNKFEYGIISLREEIKTVNFPGKLMTYLQCGMPIVMLSNKKNELTSFILKEKIGIVVNSKSNIESEISKLKKIKKYFISSDHHLKILKKNFDIKKNLERFLEI